ncbi:gamma-glutamyl-gamma-aminobutyrate hydrolase family protein [Desulfoplanes formicivorans]|uniref:Uncharacterized protein n=1 Tax=Desulfoplanes formicivorans TaxID=1592317 RepID=A0A194AJZ6_9BACT|nr:gamma-glutamyl-gamma-aminobutyrate hydrolase family protein [Desulfoplanes formicivorans]GAU09381.1 hypothetical protein DPF_2107 [Desulfoplanes formicivorans]
MKNLRIGLSMRITEAQNYSEPRDALAHDWPRFMQQVLPEANWMPLPNIGIRIIQHVQDWDLNGFILTGGNDIHEYPKRDETELALIRFALQKNIPIFGVCRGFQLILHFFGKKIFRCLTKKHAGTRHAISLLKSPSEQTEQSLIVNSYHDNCAEHVSCFRDRDALKPFAVDDNEVVEGIYHENHPLAGIMWHPERENPVNDYDQILVRNLFINSEKYT